MGTHTQTKRHPRRGIIATLVCFVLLVGAVGLTLWQKQPAPENTPPPKSKLVLDGFKVGNTPLHAGKAALATYKDENGAVKPLEITNGSLNPYKGGPLKLKPAGTCSTALQPNNPASKMCVPQIGSTVAVICNDGLNGFGIALPLDLVEDTSSIQRWLRAKAADGQDVAMGYVWLEYLQGGRKARYELTYDVNLPNCADVVRE